MKTKTCFKMFVPRRIVKRLRSAKANVMRAKVNLYPHVVLDPWFVVSNTMTWGKLVIKCPRKPKEVWGSSEGVSPWDIHKRRSAWGDI